MNSSSDIKNTAAFKGQLFSLRRNTLYFQNIPLIDMIKEYGTPLKLYYLPAISENINNARKWFTSSMQSRDYSGTYHYAYCTKSSHFKPILDKVLKENVHLEISGETDIDIIKHLYNENCLKKSNYIICNGHKLDEYTVGILDLHRRGFNVLPVLDSVEENAAYANVDSDNPLDIGLRIATNEEFSQKTQQQSRLGISVDDVIPFYDNTLKPSTAVRLKMLHFFMNTGMKDVEQFWNTLEKCLELYRKLCSICPSLDAINIGGGLPPMDRLNFNFDYQGLIDSIIHRISDYCLENELKEPDIFTELGSYSLNNCGSILYKITDQKNQSGEQWRFIDGSVMNALPDSWALKKRFMVLPINGWKRKFESVNIGGISCDADDYYNDDQHSNMPLLPELNGSGPLYIGFFNTAAYQDALGGIGGYQHCLIKEPNPIFINRDNGSFTYKKLDKATEDTSILKTLGYE